MDNKIKNLNNIEDYQTVKKELLTEYGVIKSQHFDAYKACRLRIEYFKNFILNNKRKGFVLGISGGVDSTVAGKLAQMACSELQKEGKQIKFYALRLPAGVQIDEKDAQDALNFIKPDEILTINIGTTSDIFSESCSDSLKSLKDNINLTEQQKDFHKGNVKARLRMAAQYYIAAVTETCVLGTDHNSEAIAGFWTRGGDEVADVLVLNGLNKRQVRLCAKYLGAHESLWDKPAMAGLEELSPLKIDDVGFGYNYDAQNDFLEGKKIDKDEERKIIQKYNETRYRRLPPVKFDK